jgi:hypothetical protein
MTSFICRLGLKRAHWPRVLFIVVILHCQSGAAGEPTTALIFCVASQVISALCQLSPEVAVTAATLSYAAPFIYNRAPDIYPRRKRHFYHDSLGNEMIAYDDKSKRRRQLYIDLMGHIVIMTADKDECRFILRGTKEKKKRIDKVINSLNDYAESCSPNLSFSKNDKNELKTQLEGCTNESEVLIGIKSPDKLKFERYGLYNRKGNPPDHKSRKALELIFDGEKLSKILGVDDFTLGEPKACKACRK